MYDLRSQSMMAFCGICLIIMTCGTYGAQSGPGQKRPW